MGIQLQHNWVEKKAGDSIRVSKDDMRTQLHMKLPNRNIIFFENKTIQFITLNTIFKQSINKKYSVLSLFSKLRQKLC